MGARAEIAKGNGNGPVTSGRTGVGKSKETGTGRDRDNNDALLTSGANGADDEGGSKLGSTG